MKHSRAYIIVGVLVLLLASCGQQHKAQSLADDFMADNLLAPDKLEIVDYSKLDSTKLVTDSAIQAMRVNLGKGGIFKKGIAYPVERVDRKLFRLRVSYKLDGNERTATFYLDEAIDGVVGVKTD